MAFHLLISNLKSVSQYVLARIRIFPLKVDISSSNFITTEILFLINLLDLYLLHHDQLVLVNDYSISQNSYIFFSNYQFFDVNTEYFRLILFNQVEYRMRNIYTPEYFYQKISNTSINYIF